jgi:enoyl-[acyl-carrier protein] reductase/trans-2-enoyl-CoA reductase (NAD+)
MTKRIISPTGRGFLLLDAHPDGCDQTVADMRAQVPSITAGADRSRPVALVIGSSAGYGLAITVAGLARYRIDGVGIGFERPPARRTATAGWYRTVATAAIAADHGCDFSFVNADAFADTTKDEVLDLIAKRFGGVTYLVYSVAAPRRIDPRTGTTYQSVIKPLGAEHGTKTLEFDVDGTPTLREVTQTPASEEEADATVQVMGGEDWDRWITGLVDRGLVRDGFRTVALSYIGSSLTAAVYRDGTIGAAKKHLERTAVELNDRLTPLGGRALTSVNGVAVTQASTAIPGIALYVSLLRGVLGARLQTPIQQAIQLWDQLTGAQPLDLDDLGRLRLDRWELSPEVQAAVSQRWQDATPATMADLADIDWFRTQFRQLYGFDVPGVDYEQPVEPDVPWPG